MNEADFFASAKQVSSANKYVDQYNILDQYFGVRDEFKQYLKQI